MQHQPRPPARANRALERHRKRRRRLLAAAAGIGAVLVGFVVIVGGILWTARACGGGAASRPLPPRTSRDLRLAEEQAAIDLRPAPWFCELSDERLYVALDTQRREMSPTSYPLDSLAAYELTTEDQLWQQPIDAEFSDFYLGGDNLVGFRQYRADAPRIVVSSYSAADGTRDWEKTIDNAEGGRITADGKVVILGYQQPDGYRLEALNLEQQAKAWGMKVPLEGLITQDLSTDIIAELEVRSWPGVAAYRLFNVVGLVATGSGARLREYAAHGYIHDFTLDLSSDRCFLLLAGNQIGTYSIQSLAIEGSGSGELYRFAAADDRALLVARDGILTVCYNQPHAAGEAATAKVVCLRAESREVVQEAEVPGILESVIALPDASGDLLLAVNRRREDNGIATGWGRLWRIPAAGGEVREAGRFRRAVLALVPFKDDCLVLLRGGEIYSFVSATNARRRIRRTRHDILDWLSGHGGDRLAIISTTAAYLAGQPDQPMQVIIYQ